MRVADLNLCRRRLQAVALCYTARGWRPVLGQAHLQSGVGAYAPAQSPALRAALWRQSQRQALHLPGSVPRHGLRATELSRKPARNRSLLECAKRYHTGIRGTVAQEATNRRRHGRLGAFQPAILQLHDRRTNLVLHRSVIDADLPWEIRSRKEDPSALAIAIDDRTAHRRVQECPMARCRSADGQQQKPRHRYVYCRDTATTAAH